MEAHPKIITQKIINIIDFNCVIYIIAIKLSSIN